MCTICIWCCTYQFLQIIDPNMVFSIEIFFTLGQEPLSEICRVKSCTLLFLLNLPYLWFVFVTFVQCLQFNAHILYIVPSLSLCYFIILISSHEVRPYFFTHHRLCENPLKMGELRRGAIICWHPNPHLQLIGGREHTKYIRWINFKSNIGHRDKTIRYTIN